MLIGATKWYEAYKFIADLITMGGTMDATNLANRMNEAVTNLFGNSIVNAIVLNFMVPLGTVMMVLYFMLDLYDLVTHDNFNFDTLFKCFVKFLVFLMFLINIEAVFKGVVGLSEWITEKMLASFTATFPVEDATTLPPADEDMTKFGFFYNLLIGTAAGEFSLFSIIESLLFALILYIETWYVAYDRAISLGIHYVFAPITFSRIAGNGLSPDSIGFIKQIIALSMRLPIACIVIVYLPLLKKCFEDNGVHILLLSISCVFLIKKLLKNVKTYSEDIFINGSIG